MTRSAGSSASWPLLVGVVAASVAALLLAVLGVSLYFRRLTRQHRGEPDLSTRGEVAHVSCGKCTFLSSDVCTNSMNFYKFGLF